MAKKKRPKDEAMPPPASTPTPPAPTHGRYPSRGRVKYVALPVDLYEWLERYAKAHSAPYDKKSVAWAARQIVSRAKREEEDP
jgi:hypothetical protein